MLTIKNSDLLFRAEGDYKPASHSRDFPRKRDHALQPPFGTSFGTEDGEALSNRRYDPHFNRTTTVVRSEHTFQTRKSLRQCASNAGDQHISADDHRGSSLERPKKDCDNATVSVVSVCPDCGFAAVSSPSPESAGLRRLRGESIRPARDPGNGN